MEQAQPSARAATATSHPVSDITARLASYMSEAGERPLPDKVLEQAKWHILDTIAAMISGSELPPGRAAIAFARAYAGSALATIAGDTALSGPIEAALTNGVLAHADETDDSWPNGWHPGCNTVPAALAAGEQFGISGARFVRAVALGYDVGSRVLIATRAGLADTHKATHAVAGVWGAAAAAGCAAGLTAQQMRWVLDYTAQQSSGIASWYRDSSHIEKGFVFGGMPARNGVTSALLVQLGWNGVDDIMSGRDNYLLATSPQARPDLLIDGLGERYEIARTNIKRWTVGSPIQAPLDAMEALLKRQPVDPDRVREMLVRSAPESVVDNSDPPDINIQHAMALMVIDRTVTFRSIHELSRMQDPRVLRLRARVRLEAPAGGGGTGRGAVRLPLLEVTLNDGTRLTQDTGPVLGTVENPMTREQFVAKCRDLMTPVVGESQSTRLIDRVLDLERIKDVRELRPLLQRTYRPGPPRLSEYPSRK
ncbi:MAG: MmgE/PrpD family protein [Acidobacteria bacterium]|nr:MAG: MmgE/PrpD family protein [Acidobacteriota bacterium]